MKTQTNSHRYEGQCRFCRQDFTKRKIVKHLDSCEKRKRSEKIKNLRLKITAPHRPNYWLIVECDEKANLEDLDELIRDVWVECCGHLSLFGEYGKEIGKDKIIMDILKPGDKLGYIYDFGSSTELMIEAVGYSNCEMFGKKKVELVARNYLPSSNCKKCGQQATLVCTNCDRVSFMLLCDQCAKRYKNKGEEYYFFSLANSPRCGVCGYRPPMPLEQLFDE